MNKLASREIQESYIFAPIVVGFTHRTTNYINATPYTYTRYTIFRLPTPPCQKYSSLLCIHILSCLRKVIGKIDAWIWYATVHHESEMSWSKIQSFFSIHKRSINSTNLELFTSKAEKIVVRFLAWQSGNHQKQRRTEDCPKLEHYTHPTPHPHAAHRSSEKNLVGFPIPYCCCFRAIPKFMAFFVDFLCCSIVVSCHINIVHHPHLSLTRPGSTFSTDLQGLANWLCVAWSREGSTRIRRIPWTSSVDTPILSG